MFCGADEAGWSPAHAPLASAQRRSGDFGGPLPPGFSAEPAWLAPCPLNEGLKTGGDELNRLLLPPPWPWWPSPSHPGAALPTGLWGSGGRVLCLWPPRMAPEAVSRPFLRFFVPQAWPAACPRVGGETPPLTPAGLHVLGPGVRCLLASHLTPQSLSLPIPNRSVSRSPRRLGGRRIGVQRHQAPLDAARHLCDVVGGLTREPSWRSLAGKGERARGCPRCPPVGESGEGGRGTVAEEGHSAEAQLSGRRGLVPLGTPSAELRPGHGPRAKPGRHSAAP